MIHATIPKTQAIQLAYTMYVYDNAAALTSYAVYRLVDGWRYVDLAS